MRRPLWIIFLVAAVAVTAYLLARPATAPADTTPATPPAESGGRYIIVDGKPVLVNSTVTPATAPANTPTPAPTRTSTPAPSGVIVGLTPPTTEAAPVTQPTSQPFRFNESTGAGTEEVIRVPLSQLHAGELKYNVVIRPGDPEETVGAFVAAISKTSGPTLLALSRQAIPMLNDLPVATRREGVLKGAYIAVKEKGPLKAIILSCGSELQHAVSAAKTLGDGIRVVSMPCFERFDLRQDVARDGQAERCGQAIGFDRTIRHR